MQADLQFQEYRIKKVASLGGSTNTATLVCTVCQKAALWKIRVRRNTGT